ncbi:hypothetical protein FF011L_20180 [Roseimaritima multifibrata]|uniref:Uncharacterized protein n=1 Tax=Roseimaritima multifibrata TaxID=1930274 RepID=A0A517MEJ0_9BACT|nr:hypothetical protein [Roseimaritima multifibrata]QDS93256.1 hypothetical protein FF011L_20180 [Roseimaritima multifibrata]
MRRDRALALLTECTGDDIWSPEHCRKAGVPESWIDELSEAYESGFQSDRQTIYYQEKVVNQYHGIRDIELAKKLGTVLGIDVPQTIAFSLRPSDAVNAIWQAVFEG